jgi:hypothetical protein
MPVIVSCGRTSPSQREVLLVLLAQALEEQGSLWQSEKMQLNEALEAARATSHQLALEV